MPLSKMKKNEFRTLVRVLAHDLGEVRIGNAALDLLTQVLLDQQWMEIFDRNVYYVSQADTVTVASPGYIDLRQTTDGKLSKRFYRIQSVVRDGQTYSPLDPRNVGRQPSAVAADQVFGSNVRSRYRWSLYGDQLHLFPYDTTGNVDVMYAYLPTLYTTLGETDPLPWPNGHEAGLALWVAAHVNPADTALRPAALAALAETLFAVARPYSGPVMPYQTDTPQAHGAE